MDESLDEQKPGALQRFIKFVLISLLVLIITAGVAITAAWTWYDRSLTSVPDPNGETVTFTIYPGQSVKGIASALKQNGLISDANVFRLALKIQRKDGSLQAGTYHLSPASSMQTTIDSLLSGKNEEGWITTLSGWRIEDIATYLETKGVVDAAVFIEKAYAAAYEFPFLSDAPPYFKPAGQSLEGYLFPDSYLIPTTATADDIIEIMLNNFQDKFDSTIAPLQNGRSLYDIVTMASIVEKEGRDLEEKQMIAGIFYNRLELGMTLGSDVTIHYIIGNWKASLTADDLDIDSPYNTRTHPGLPPGPIASPGLDSLIAAVEPTSTDYLYFLADKDGIMRYAKTNAEHEANKARYGLSGQ
ncbi:hypothetical protein AUK40_00575 [Candidatus Wirthbacteria bacterium CG2_30_54_11]|uniref:Endolytic murein transglycosylase n=1 Tax=Candidatus Wirthbacteria bacterium CG2_30_54_11 TaxID=1817892 RepID=A0A1J5J899_9BACT|nr:MAG: hypothetical protein AUK40_00575 [Candidatus Wirthbacteria bacterium CG2_30_54_11]